jgi:hypothetical protein
MRKAIAFISLYVLVFSANGQDEKKWNIGVYADLTKLNNPGFLEHLQAAAEVNYQLIKPLSITTGFEIWVPAQGPGVVAGVRYYPYKNIFLRLRRIFFIDSNAIGAGWKKPLGKNNNFEAMADYYSQKTFAVRIGMSRSF